MPLGQEGSFRERAHQMVSDSPSGFIGKRNLGPFFSHPLTVAIIAAFVGGLAGTLTGVFIPRAFPATPKCTDNSRFVEDVSIPDDTIFSPNTEFVKTWRLKNPKAEGICRWSDEYNVVWAGDENLASKASFDIPTTKPGDEALITIPMNAPQTPGEYKSTWILRNPRGVTFGDKFWVKILVR